MNKDLKVFIMCGLPAAGKTEKAIELIRSQVFPKTRRVSKDHCRWMAYCLKPFGPYLYNRAHENDIKDIRDILILFWLKKGCNVIVDDTNLKGDDIREIKAVVGDSAQIEIVDLRSVPLETCLERNRLREEGYRVPEERIRQMYRLYIEDKS